MKEMSLLSEGKTEGLYHLQTVPTETYVLNYVLASTIGKFRSRREQKNRTPKVRKVSKYKEKSGILRLPIFGTDIHNETDCFRHYPYIFQTCLKPYVFK